MGSLKHQHGLIAEVSHQINSPLAAIRNALFLASSKIQDPEVRHYLELADEEVTSIANRIRDLRAQVEQLPEWDNRPVFPTPPQILRKAA
jgi:signal transduction histidine kinase